MRESGYADRILAICSIVGGLGLIGLNLYEYGRDSMRQEIVSSCPAGTAYSVRYQDGRLKCVGYQEPMKRSKIEEVRRRNYLRGAV